jgi:methionyl-tRNA formyltransferase
MSARHIVALTKLETAWFVVAGKRVRVLQAEMDTTSTTDGVAPGEIVGSDARGVRVACGDGVVVLITVQPEGKTPMSATAWANGARLPASLA